MGREGRELLAGRMMTFPLLHRNNQHQLRASIRRRLRPPREEEGRERREHGRMGEGASRAPLGSSALSVRHKGIGLIGHRGGEEAC